MHAHLTNCIQALKDLWQGDPRAVAFSMNGSGGRGSDDKWSDGDVVLVVKDEAYPAIREEMRALMERICGKICAWITEGDSATGVNFAFLFEYGGEQFLFDHSLLCEGSIHESSQLDAGIIFFDESGALTQANASYAAHRPSFNVENLINTYLIYAQITGKYYRRGDTAKLLYIQNTLQGLHLKVLAALYPQRKFTGWWCRDIEVLSEEHQKTILLYAAPPADDHIAALTRRELDLFAADARAACAIRGIEFPEDGEAFVRKHLTDSGVFV